MPVLTVVALALVVVIVAAAMLAVARGRRGQPLAPPALEPTPTEPVEPALAEGRRSIVPPAVTEALAWQPEATTEPALAPAEEAEPAPAEEAAPAPAPAEEAAPAPAPAEEAAPALAPAEEAAPAQEAAPAPAPVEEVAATPAPPPAPEPAAVPAATPVVAVVSAADRTSIEAGDPERKKARKLARLFVSEIKLYNEKLVAEGRAAGDLYARLKDPIDQSRVAFERRIPEAVRAEFDYVHDELVRQLAEGDARKLGTHYRRPSRES
jgi:hypothetical protein